MQCSLVWKRLRSQSSRKGDRITRDLVEMLMRNGPVEAESLDATLQEFGLGVSIKQRVSRQKPASKDAPTSITKEALLAAMQ